MIVLEAKLFQEHLICDKQKRHQMSLENFTCNKYYTSQKLYKLSSKENCIETNLRIYSESVKNQL